LTDKKKIVRIINVADYSSSLLQWAQIAQLVEQRTENPRVTGSIPVLGINPYKYYLAVFVGVFYVQLLPVTAHNSLSAEINCRAETENTHDAKGVEDGTFLKYN
jgi:hypothetical protein